MTIASIRPLSVGESALLARTGAAGICLPGGDAPVDEAPRPTERVSVVFDAEGAGIGELTWGQSEIWATLVRQRTWMPLGGRKPLHPGTSVADVAEELAYLMGRFQSMRTLLRFDADGRPYQRLFDSGQITLEIYDAAGTEADAVAAAVEAHYRHRPVDFAREWPIRMAVIRADGEPAHMVVLIGHIATDGAGGQLMVRDVEARNTTPVTGMQPLELARWQGSPAGQRLTERALRHVGNTLSAIPVRDHPVSAGRRRPRYWTGEFESSALDLAALMIARRTSADASSVLLALYALALADLVGNPVVVRPVVNNRFRSQLSDVVYAAAQPGICALDVAGASVDEAVETARRAAINAYKYAYLDPEQLAALIAHGSGPQGPDFGLSCYFNDRRTVVRAGTGAPATPRQLRDAQSVSTFTWTGKRDNPIEILFLHLDDVPQGVRLTIETDTHCFSPLDAEGLVRRMEAIAVAAAHDPAASRA